MSCDGKPVFSGRAWQLAFGLRGRVEAQRGVISRRGREISVETDGETGFNVDGKLVAARSARFTVEPHAFELVVD